jgi:hypothetical protein
MNLRSAPRPKEVHDEAVGEAVSLVFGDFTFRKAAQKTGVSQSTISRCGACCSRAAFFLAPPP